MANAAALMLPILTRDNSGINIRGYHHPDKFVDVEGRPSVTGAQAITLSEDGRRLAVALPDAVVVQDTLTGRQEISLPVKGAVAVALSPGGRYLVTYQRPSTDPSDHKGNVVAWDLKSGAEALRVFQKKFDKESWPTLDWSKDDSIACRVVQNEVQFYDGNNLGAPLVARLHVKGLASASLSPPSAPAKGTTSPEYFVAVYVPEIKGAPASVRLFSFSSVVQSCAASKSDPSSQPTAPDPVARKSFFKASSVRTYWNKLGTALLVYAHTDVDKTNKSYYGESNLHFVTADGRNEGSVPLSKEGPVQDVAWSPLGTHFVVVYGFMPAKATLFDATAKPIFDFGTGPRNTVKWDPHGQFLALAGFGNLPGDVEFWDCQKQKLLGKTRAECAVTCEWAPDGRHLMTATVAPRMRVDNCIRIFKYNGEQLFKKDYDALYEASWVPLPASNFPPRPASPGAVRTQSAGGAAAEKKPAAYRPPHATGTSSLNISMMSASDGPGKIGQRRGGTPGADFVAEPPKAASKNAKRRGKKKQDGSGAAGADDEGDAGGDEEVATVTQGMAACAVSAPAALEGGADEAADPSKRLRNLTKKLRAIEQLKEKQAGGATLTPEQLEKVAQEGAIKAEIASLQ
eukprot:jgi/Mesvir1/27465/Mv07243-RA.3